MRSGHNGPWQPWRLPARIALMVALLLIAMPAYSVLAAPGDPETSFNTTGIVTTDFNGSFDEAHAVTFQTGGKILAAGSSNASGGVSRFALARYDGTGNLDGTFGSGGKVTTEFTGMSAQALAMAVQPDGKIVLAGRAIDVSSDSDLALARYNANGTLDTAFGTGGRVTTDIPRAPDPPTDDGLSAVAIQSSDGKIVVAGYSSTGWLVARYEADGDLDTTFGTAGTTTLDFGSSLDTAHALGLQSDGKIVVAGSGNAGITGDFALARLSTTGGLDSSFSGDGKLLTDFGGTGDTAYALGLQSDGKIVAAGRGGASGDFALARYSSSGNLDFSGLKDVGSGNDYARSLAIQPDGKFVLAGVTSTGAANNDFALARFTTGGSADSSFDGDGIVKFNLRTFTSDDHAFAIAVDLQSDTIVAAGGSVPAGGTSDFAVATRILGLKPRVTTSPSPQTVVEGNSAAFTAAATGDPTPSIRWQRSTNAGGTWADISGATSSTYNIASTSYAQNGHQFRAVFTNTWTAQVGEVPSSVANLRVYLPPTVTTQPVAQTVCEGTSATYTVASTGDPAPTYQWQVSTRFRDNMGRRGRRHIVHPELQRHRRPEWEPLPCRGYQHRGLRDL